MLPYSCSVVRWCLLTFATQRHATARHLHLREMFCTFAAESLDDSESSEYSEYSEYSDEKRNSDTKQQHETATRITTTNTAP